MEEDLDELILSSDDLTDTLKSLLTNDNFEDVSSDESEEVNDQNSEDEGLPSHTFEVKDTIVKSGKRKGTNATRVSLIIENYIFRKRRELKSGHVTFSCNLCEADGKFVSATAVHIDGQYHLRDAPRPEEHSCWA